MSNSNLSETVKNVFCEKLKWCKFLTSLYGGLLILFCVGLVVPFKDVPFRFRFEHCIVVPQIITLVLKISQAQWTLSIASAIQQVWIKHEQLDVVLIVLFWSSASVCISVWIARSKSMYNFNLCETVKKVFCKKLHPWKLLKFLYGVLVLLICVVLVVPTKRYDSNTTLM